ncbi:MAG: enoyl-CoA hydratase, partial [Chloroflexi bacterium]|nr:enoyl-CoA hydratase [Chloroflexota bacterium]
MPPSDYTQIIYEQHDRVAKIVLNRPRYRNAQSRLLLEELDHAFGYAAEDDSIGAIVLAGAGDHFSAGHDL